jgi:hypothetical protein
VDDPEVLRDDTVFSATVIDDPRVVEKILRHRAFGGGGVKTNFLK